LRNNPTKRGRRTGFDEKKLAAIRKYEGTEAFFSWQRNLLGKKDGMLSWIIPNKSKYILIGVAEK
jgi:hypothetical protein